MLVLTRKHQERVHIGNDITLTIVRIKGNAVRIGIEAPGDVRIMRGEVAKGIADQQAAVEPQLSEAASTEPECELPALTAQDLADAKQESGFHVVGMFAGSTPAPEMKPMPRELNASNMYGEASCGQRDTAVMHAV